MCATLIYSLHKASSSRLQWNPRWLAHISDRDAHKPRLINLGVALRRREHGLYHAIITLAMRVVLTLPNPDGPDVCRDYWFSLQGPL